MSFIESVRLKEIPRRITKVLFDFCKFQIFRIDRPVLDKTPDFQTEKLAFLKEPLKRKGRDRINYKYRGGHNRSCLVIDLSLTHEGFSSDEIERQVDPEKLLREIIQLSGVSRINLLPKRVSRTKYKS